MIASPAVFAHGERVVYAAARASALVVRGSRALILAPSGIPVRDSTDIVRDNPDLFVTKTIDGVMYVVPA